MKREKLGERSAVKGTMLSAHVSWVRQRAGAFARLERGVNPRTAPLLSRAILATEWVPLRALIDLDRAIASAVGGHDTTVFRDLGRYSASLNLGGIYKQFKSTEPHLFFGQMTVLHRQFQNFGSCRYEKTGDRAGRITFHDYSEYSPVYCMSGLGYFEEALRVMQAPGPIGVTEKSCQCAGDAMCSYDMRW